jgi:hypothetical protein
MRVKLGTCAVVARLAGQQNLPSTHRRGRDVLCSQLAFLNRLPGEETKAARARIPVALRKSVTDTSLYGERTEGPRAVLEPIAATDVG